jgi:hypothetical protein
MATRWYIETVEPESSVTAAFADVFFERPSFGERAKFWSRKAQLRSNLRWERSDAADAVIAARLVSGGIREAAQSSKRGGGSIIGTTIAMAFGDGDDTTGITHAQLWLAHYNTYFGMNQQGDIIRLFTKQIADRLRDSDGTVRVHK